MAIKRVNIKAILADADLRRKLMVSTIQATQAREGIDTTPEQADRAYYVVSEAERTTFFDLVRFSGRGVEDKRHLRFVAALGGPSDRIRRDVARRDFESIEGVPIAYARVGLVAHAFRDHPALEPAWGVARQGKATGDDSRWVRQWWEVDAQAHWVPFAKGGEFCRFYDDVDLVLDWNPDHREELNASGNGLPSQGMYFKAGLTWPLAVTVFNVRLLPGGCVFGYKGPAISPHEMDNVWYLAGVLNSELMLAFGETLTSRENMGGRWEVGVVKRFPVPTSGPKERRRIEEIARSGSLGFPVALYSRKIS